MFNSLTLVRILVLSLLATTPAVSQGQFTVLPNWIELNGTEAASGTLVQKVEIAPEGSASVQLNHQIRAGIQMHVANPEIARVEGDRVIAVGNGVTELLVQVQGESRIARVPITVTGVGYSQPWQFTAHIQSVLSRQGCNSGACHGALAGKGGFRLSLLGYDWQLDHYTIASQDQGRRIELAKPESSLLLGKPTMEVAHKGGLRLNKDSQDYRVLKEWIAQGASGPTATDAKLIDIEVLPKNFQAQLGGTQQLLVRARYADGRMEDVTHWARFSSANRPVADVNQEGLVSIMGQGRAGVVAWFASRIAIASIDVAYRQTDESASEMAERDLALQRFAPKNPIDQVLVQEWRSMGLAPSPACDDATFMRRAYIDLTGTLPAPQQVIDFLGNTQPDKREQLIDQLLSSVQYVDYWAYKWSDLLLVNGNLLRPAAVDSFYRWIRQQVQQNRSWDQFAREILLAKGDSFENGATNFYAIHQSPEAMTENTCLAFMGLSIECAKCHNHPLERWTNDQYYAMANLFSRVRAKGWGGDARNGDGKRTLIVLERGDLIQPSRGQPQPPAPLDQPALDPDSNLDRRIVLADWLTGDQNDYFARSIVNRVWANFFGVGIVESVDDLRTSNPASSERLMNTLTDYLRQHRYDIKALIRWIMNSQTYQLSSIATSLNQADSRFYCRYYPRRLMAEVLHDAFVTVTEVPTAFDKIEFTGADKQPTSNYPLGTNSLALYDSAVSSYFLQTFGRHQRRITCECERSDQPTVVQVLHLSNGTTINEKLSNEQCILSGWLAQGLSNQQMIEQAYLRTLSRLPSPSEIQQAMTELTTLDAPATPEAAAAQRREVLEDLLWSLMSSSEFLFAH